jgi:hypothetical protein
VRPALPPARRGGARRARTGVPSICEDNTASPAPLRLRSATFFSIAGVSSHTLIKGVSCYTHNSLGIKEGPQPIRKGAQLIILQALGQRSQSGSRSRPKFRNPGPVVETSGEKIDAISIAQNPKIRWIEKNQVILISHENNDP